MTCVMVEFVRGEPADPNAPKVAMSLACDALEDIIASAKDMQDVILANGAPHELAQAQNRVRTHCETYIAMMAQAATATNALQRD